MSNEQENPLVSVIIPTYKRPDMLGRAIESVLNQTYYNIEIIVVDDNNEGSEYRKETENFMKKYSNVDKLVYLKHKVNKGGSAARNTGITASFGKYIAFLDDDDEWVKEKLFKQIKKFKELGKEYGVVYHPYLKKLENRNKLVPRIKNKKKYNGDINKLLLEGNFIGTPVVLLKKEVLDKVGFFDEELPRLQDWELWIRISLYYKFKLINEPLTLVNVTNESISTNDYSLIKAKKIILEKHYDVFKNAGAEFLAKQYYGIGNNYNLCLDIHNGRQYLKKAIKNSFNLKYIFSYLLSFLGNDFYNFFYKLWGKFCHR